MIGPKLNPTFSYGCGRLRHVLPAFAQHVEIGFTKQLARRGHAAQGVLGLAVVR